MGKSRSNADLASIMRYQNDNIILNKGLGFVNTGTQFDEYQIGTWSPSCNISNMDIYSAHYALIDDLVYISFDIGWDDFVNANGTGAVQIGNLPFNPIDDAAGSSAAGCSHISSAFIENGYLYFGTQSDQFSGTMNKATKDGIVSDIQSYGGGAFIELIVGLWYRRTI